MIFIHNVDNYRLPSYQHHHSRDKEQTKTNKTTTHINIKIKILHQFFFKFYKNHVYKHVPENMFVVYFLSADATRSSHNIPFKTQWVKTAYTCCSTESPFCVGWSLSSWNRRRPRSSRRTRLPWAPSNVDGDNKLQKIATCRHVIRCAANTDTRQWKSFCCMWIWYIVVHRLWQLFPCHCSSSLDPGVTQLSLFPTDLGCPC